MVDLLNANELTRLVSEYEIDVIYHLAALLSTRGEFTPEMAHRVNVEGTRTLLDWRPSNPSGAAAGAIYLPQFHRHLWHARPGEQTHLPARARI